MNKKRKNVVARGVWAITAEDHFMQNRQLFKKLISQCTEEDVKLEAETINLQKNVFLIVFLFMISTFTLLSAPC